VGKRKKMEEVKEDSWNKVAVKKACSTVRDGGEVGSLGLRAGYAWRLRGAGAGGRVGNHSEHNGVLFLGVAEFHHWTNTIAGERWSNKGIVWGVLEKAGRDALLLREQC
jgi:hypothetical protein